MKYSDLGEEKQQVWLLQQINLPVPHICVEGLPPNKSSDFSLQISKTEIWLCYLVKAEEQITIIIMCFASDFHPLLRY